MHVLCLPSEPISLIVADDRLPTLLDDHAGRLLNQDTVTLAHLAASPAHIIKTGRIILSRRWHEGALQLRRLAPAFGFRMYRLHRGAGLVAGGYRVAQLLLQRAGYAALCRFIEYEYALASARSA